MTLSVSAVLHPCFNASKQTGQGEDGECRVCRRGKRPVPVPKVSSLPRVLWPGDSIVNLCSQGCFGLGFPGFSVSLGSGCDPWGVDPSNKVCGCIVQSRSRIRRKASGLLGLGPYYALSWAPVLAGWGREPLGQTCRLSAAAEKAQSAGAFGRCCGRTDPARRREGGEGWAQGGGAGLTRPRWPIAVPGGRGGREPPLKGRCDQEARPGSGGRNTRAGD